MSAHAAIYTYSGTNILVLGPKGQNHQNVNEQVSMSWEPTGGEQTIKQYSENTNPMVLE